MVDSCVYFIVNKRYKISYKNYLRENNSVNEGLLKIAGYLGGSVS